MAKDEAKITKKTEQEVKRLGLKLDQITRTESILNPNQIQRIFNATKSRYTYTRPGKGGGQWTFVRASYIRRTLDAVFGFNWDFEIETSVAEALDVATKTGTCVVKGVLTARTKHNGEWIELKKTQFGRKEVAFKKDTTQPLDIGNDIKAAASDALKKCAASGLGLAADIYDPDEFLDIEVIGADRHIDKDEHVKKLVKATRDKLKEEGVEVDEG